MLFRLSHATPHFYLLTDLSTTYLPSYLSLSWASLIAQLVKNPSAMQETWVQFLGWGDPLGEGKGYPLLYSGLENSMDCIVHGLQIVRHNWATFTFFLSQLSIRKSFSLSYLFGNLSLSAIYLERAMATYSSTLAWKIPWMEEPGRLQSMGSLRVGHDWATSLSLFTFMHWKRKWQPTPVFLPGESQGRGSLVGCHLWGSTELDTTEVS